MGKFNVSVVQSEPRVKCWRELLSRRRTMLPWETEAGLPKIRNRRGKRSVLLAGLQQEHVIAVCDN